LAAAGGLGETKQHAPYIGVDVHKDTIAELGRGKPIYRGEIANTPK